MIDLHDLAAPYVLDALDNGEAASFEAHLESCDRCQTEVAQLRGTAVGLAEAVAVTPPSHLKDMVMAATATGESATVVPLQPRRRSTGWVAALAAAAVAIVFFGLWVAASNDLDQANRIAAVYEAPDATFVVIESPQGPARFVYSPSLEAGVFNGGELGALSEDDVYQLWLVGSDSVISAGTLIAGEEAVLVESFPPGAMLAMTIEVAPGVDAPTMDPLFVAEL